MSTYHFSVIIEQDEHGYFVRCPELQGCYSQGETYEEAMENIRDAITLHVDDQMVRHEVIFQSKYP
ncbi:MAG: type II toxin-antitoxin system HicB family antitoxin [bacterium]|nr:type II toxin-antitoxin system HicB family antitoxin [bacterium]MDZ4285951.1 type II toxin-antitoxin system HicB family antitoxin [Candidatus Sungbacteria bacterium]